jgi:glycosyltransferase involved in cell wall biosynthesis
VKLIIQIPCYNEENTLPITLAALPRQVAGVDCVEWLVINDGSCDRTVALAQEHGVDHIISFAQNRGLAKAFMAGIEASLKAGADLIVNTDADNQYCADDIGKLIAPILEGRAEIVIGARPISQIEHFSPTKKLLQRIGSWVIRKISDTDIPDAPSGFRAISREAAMRINVLDDYTYTLDMIIQAGQRGMAVTSVPVRTNPFLRPSRLVRSILSYVQRSLFAILRIFAIYQPLKFFLILGSIPFGCGLILVLRWLVLFLAGTHRTHVPSLIAASILILIGFQLWILGLVADLVAANRKLLEDIQFRTRRLDFDAR